MDWANVFASKCSTNDKAINDMAAKWFREMKVLPETEQLIAEVLMEKALGGSQCSRAYAKDMLSKMKKTHPIDELKIIETIEKTKNKKAFQGESALKCQLKKIRLKLGRLFSVLFGKITIKGVD